MSSKITTEDFIQKSSKIHPPQKYDYSKVHYTNNRNKVCIICLTHGEFLQSPFNHLMGKGCPDCAKEKVSKICFQNNKKNVIPFEIMVQRFHQKHSNKYQYIKPNQFRGYRQKITIICPKHGIFIQQVQSHLNGAGCSKCANEGSKDVKIIQKYLQNQNIIYKTEKRFKDCRNKLPLPFDFYLPEYNICIEFDGIQHFKPTYGEEKFKQRKINDSIKNKYCKENNINLIRIPYWESSNIENLIFKELLS